MMSRNADLYMAAQALYGERWQNELSRNIGVSDRTVRRWASGKIDVPEDIWGVLVMLLRLHKDIIDDRINEIVRRTK